MNNIVIPILVIISIFTIIILTSRFRLHAFVALFIVSLFLAFTTLPPHEVMTAVKEGFGSTMGSIGFLIILGAMIGIILDKTGGTLSIANYILGKTGKRRSAEAMGITGYITGLPIFCDSGFIILSGLAKSLSAKSMVPAPFITTALACSLYSVHCLIPPHPGALAAAGMMNVNIGYLIMAGAFLAIPGVVAAFFWSRWISRKLNTAPANPSPDERIPRQELPPVFFAFLPVAAPLLLITVKSLITIADKSGGSIAAQIFLFPGEPVIALSIGVLLALFLVREKSVRTMNELFSEAVVKAGPILIITAAGGMFGLVIRSTGTGELLGKMLADTGAGLIVPFLIAAVMKTAQGSSTVAIITAAAFIAPMLPVLNLESETGRLLATLSMGAGSMFVSHANDSYFWVVSNFGELETNTSLKVYSTSTMIMGTVVFACILILSLLIK